VQLSKSRAKLAAEELQDQHNTGAAAETCCVTVVVGSTYGLQCIDSVIGYNNGDEKEADL